MYVDLDILHKGSPGSMQDVCHLNLVLMALGPTSLH